MKCKQKHLFRLFVILCLLVGCALVMSTVVAAPVQPDKVVFRVYQNGALFGEYELTAPGWYLPVTAPKFDPGNVPYVYTVEEVPIAGFYSLYSTNENTTLDDYYFSVSNFPTDEPPETPTTTQPPPTETPTEEPPTSEPPFEEIQTETPPPPDTGNIVNTPPQYSLPPVPPDENGRYTEFDDDGIPQGEWVWDDDNGWVFEPIQPPLRNLPRTGVPDLEVYVLSLLGLLLLCVGLTLKLRIRHVSRRNTYFTSYVDRYIRNPVPVQEYVAQTVQPLSAPEPEPRPVAARGLSDDFMAELDILLSIVKPKEY